LKRRRSPFGLVLLFLLCFSVTNVVFNIAPTQAAEPLTFSDIINISDSYGISAFPQLAASGGNVYLAWWDRQEGKPARVIIRASRDNGVTFDPTIALFCRDSGSYYADSKYPPQIVADGNDVYVVWEQWCEHVVETLTGGTFPIFSTDIFVAASHDNGVTFEINGVSETKDFSYDPRIAVSGSDVYVLWTEVGWCDSMDRGLWCAKIEMQPNGTTVIAKNRISQSHELSWGHNIAASGGNVYVAWVRTSNQSGWSMGNDLVFSRKNSSRADFETLGVIGGAPYWHPPEMAAFGNNVYVAWTTCWDISDGDVFVAVSQDNGTSFSLVNLSSSPNEPRKTLPIMKTTGNSVYVVWTQSYPHGAGDYVMFARSTGNGTSFTYRYLSSEGYTQRLYDRGGLAVSGSYVYIVFEQERGARDVFLKMSSNGGDTFGPKINLSANNGTSVFSTVAACGELVYVAWADNSNGTSPPGSVEHDLWDMDIFFKLGSIGEPDLVLKEVKPVQASFDAEVLVEGKKTLLEVKILNVSPQKKDVGIRLLYETTDDSGNKIVVTKDEIKSCAPGENVLHLPSDGFIKPKEPDFFASVIVDPNNTIIESNEDNNAETIIDFPVKNTNPFRVLYVPLQLPDDTAVDPKNMCDFGLRSNSYLLGTFPISEDEFGFSISITPYTPDISGFTGGLLTESQLRELYTDLTRLRLQVRYGFYPANKVVAVVENGWFSNHTADFKNAIGLAYMTDNDAVIVEQECLSGVVTAHEIAHTYNWVVSGDLVEDPGSPAHTHELAAPGYWVAERKSMTSFADFMNAYLYPQIINNWVSDATFSWLLRSLKVDRSDPDPTVIVMSGTLFRNGTMMLDPWFRFNSTLDIPLSNPGNLTILFVDKYGNTIDQTGFDVSFYGPHRVEADVGGFVLRIPDVEGTTKIVIKNGTQVLAERDISPNPPQVKVTSPNGGEIYRGGDNVTVRWESSDVDGETLTYTISFSEDNGGTWVPLAQDLTSTEFNFRAQINVHTNSALIKVVATDGINTAEDTSDSTFSVRPRMSVGDPVTLVNTSIFNQQIASSDNNVYVAWNKIEDGAFLRASNDWGTSFSPAIDVGSSIMVASDDNVYVVRITSGKEVFLRASTDGGATFNPGITLSNATLGSALLVQIAAQGRNVYVVWVQRTSVSLDTKEVFFRRSTDRGASFESAISLGTLSSGTELPSIATYDNNVYVVWLDIPLGSVHGQGHVFFRASNNSGATFGPAIDISNTTYRESLHPKVVSSGSNVYVAWEKALTDTGYPNRDILVKTSSDCGATFSSVTNIANNVSFGPPFCMSASENNVYIAWFDVNPYTYYQDVLLRASNDGGATFGPAINVADDVNVRITYSLKMAASGNNIYVAWRDDIENPPYSWKGEIFLRASSDGGATFGLPINLSNSTTVDSIDPDMATSDANLYVSWREDQDTGDYGVCFRAILYNRPPVAQAGSNQTVLEETLVTLNGSASYDSDLDPLTYSWTQIRGPTVILSDPNSAQPTFTAPSVDVPTVLEFRLTVNDGTTDSAPSTVEITVENVPPPEPEFIFIRPQFDTLFSGMDSIKAYNQRPIANAGVDQTVNRGTLVTLNGSASSDPDGDTLVYLWIQTGGARVTLSNTNTSAPTFTAPVDESILTFEMMVYDGKIDSLPDMVQITVTTETDSTPPTIGIPSRDPAGDIIESNQPVKISVNVTDLISQVKNVTLYYSLDNGTTWEEPLPMSFNASTNFYEVTIPGQQAGTWVRFKIVAYDFAGNNATLDGTEPYCSYQVIPEFPTHTILMLFMITTLIAVIILHRRKQLYNCSKNQ